MGAACPAGVQTTTAAASSAPQVRLRACRRQRSGLVCNPGGVTAQGSSRMVTMHGNASL